MKWKAWNFSLACPPKLRLALYFEVRLKNIRSLDSFYYTAAAEQGLASPTAALEWKYSKCSCLWDTHRQP